MNNKTDLPSVAIMDIDITDIFKPMFTYELWVDIEKSLSIMEQFELPDLYDKATELMSMTGTEEADTLKDMFYNDIVSKMYYLLKMHSVRLSKDASLAYLNELAEFFLTVQHLADYDSFYSYFNSTKTNDEIMFEILEEYTSVPSVIWAGIGFEYEEVLVLMLKSMCEQKLGIVQVDTNPDTIRLKAKAFVNMSVLANMGHENSLGVQLAMMQTLMGQPLSTYISLAKDNLLSNESDKDLATDFLSICLISKEQDTNPYTLWSEHSDDLDMSIGRAISIQSEINNLYTTFTQYLKAKYEQDRVS